MPSGGNVYGGGFYRNSSVSGHWGDYIGGDLVRFIDGRFRTLARPGARAVIGFSMGGYGAIHMAMERPDIFSVAYAQSPCCLAPVEELGLGCEAWARISTMRAAEARDLVARGEYVAAGVLGFLTAIRPAPDSAPLRVALPFRVVDGRHVPDGAAFDAYVAQFPISRIARSKDALQSLRGLALDYGVADENAHIPLGAAEFSRRLTDARIPHRLDVFVGGHLERTSDRLRTIAIPFAANRLDPPE